MTKNRYCFIVDLSTKEVVQRAISITAAKRDIKLYRANFRDRKFIIVKDKW